MPDIPGIRVRVGDKNSPVNPGDPVPTGGRYRAGMFAPTLDELATLTLTEADRAGLLPGLLPIYGDDGEVDEKKVEGWNPNSDLADSGIFVSDEVPKYSAAAILTSTENMGGWLKNLGLRHIFAGTDEDTPKGIFGEQIIAANTSGKGRKFMGSLTVYPPFYKYISIPLVGKVPGRTTGLSVASFAVHHAVGHILFSRLTFDGRLDILGDFIEVSGWTKYADIGAYHGSYMEAKNPSVWRRDTHYRFETELSKYSPADDFAEAFALYFTHREYLETAFPKKMAVMEKALKEYGAL